MRFRQVAIQLDRLTHVIDRLRQQRGVRVIARTRHLVLEEVRVGQTDVRCGVARVQLDRPFEVADRPRHLRRFERLEPDAPLGEHLVGLEAARLTRRPAQRRAAAAADGRRELGDDPVLQIEDVRQPAVRLAVGQRLAARRIHRPGGDPQPVA